MQTIPRFSVEILPPQRPPCGELDTTGADAAPGPLPLVVARNMHQHRGESADVNVHGAILEASEKRKHPFRIRSAVAVLACDQIGKVLGSDLVLGHAAQDVHCHSPSAASTRPQGRVVEGYVGVQCRGLHLGQHHQRDRPLQGPPGNAHRDRVRLHRRFQATALLHLREQLEREGPLRRRARRDGVPVRVLVGVHAIARHVVQKRAADINADIAACTQCAIEQQPINLEASFPQRPERRDRGLPRTSVLKSRHCNHDLLQLQILIAK
mmetsp:Transcript_88222/g.248317  ORF Transcript_88222/g.248317 Transcript_88222/m.248317 type:complete len:267 (-) Transcript_88222:388-1188(-)